MKYKKIVSVVLAFALLFSITSCGSAPAEEKDVNIAAEKAPFKPEVVISDEKTDDAEEETEQEAPLEEGQERVTTSFTSEDGAISYNIDAVMSGTDITSLPTFTVTPAIYTSEELELISKTLAGDSVVYAFSETVARPVLEEMLIKKKAYIADRDALMEYYGNNEDTVNYRIDEVSGEIADIERDLPYAPDEVPKNEPEYVYKPDVEYAAGNEYVFVPTYPKWDTFRALTEVNGTNREIIISQGNREGWFDSNVWLHEDLRIGSTYQQTRWNCYQTEPFTEAEIEAAKEDVMNILHEMGFEYWVIDVCEPYEINLDEFYEGKDTEGLPISSGVVYALHMELSQQFAEPVQFRYLGEKTWESNFDGTDYNNPLRASSIRLYYSGGNIIEFYGTSLYKIEEETENLQLLSYDDAKDAIINVIEDVWDADMISQYYTNLTGSVSDVRVILDAEVSVERMELVYVSIPVEGDDDSFELVPAWAVYGKAALNEYKIGYAHVSPSIELRDPLGVDSPILLVDARDGSKITLIERF